jgi:hypothetical protein
LRTHDYRGRTALTAHSEADAELLRQKGTSIVFLPFADAAEQAADEITGASAPRSQAQV